MTEKKTNSNIWLIIVGILAGFGVFFLLALLVSGPENESGDTRKAKETVKEREEEEVEESAEDEVDAERDISDMSDSEVSDKEEGSSADMASSGNDEESGQQESAKQEEHGENSATPTGTGNISMGKKAQSATVMIYMNGSDLETKAGEATADISEMVDSGVGKNVNVIIQTMGTKKWHDYGISSKTAQTYKVEDGGLTLIRDDLGKIDCTKTETLSEFIGFCKTDYPADRYVFLFWNHGGGPVYGFGYDEWQGEDASLTISEMHKAFSEHTDIHFDIIGMDCCIMASMETCFALSPYCKYAILSEDFESGIGWYYTDWMKKLEEQPGIASPLLGKYIVDGMIGENESSAYGESSCMSMFNESTIRSVYSAWMTYAYKNEDALLGKNYSRNHIAKGRGLFEEWQDDGITVTMQDYYISDMLALIESIDSESDEAKKLISALKAAVVYYGHTSDKNELTGMAVSLPYGDSYFYKDLKKVYQDLGMDQEYIDWLGNFTDSRGNDDYFDYNYFDESWGGWGDYESEYGGNSCGDGSCEYGYDYDECSDCGYYEEDDDWIYDSEMELWYTYDENGELYLYDDESETLLYYDEYADEVYYYDEYDDEWYYLELE